MDKSLLSESLTPSQMAALPESRERAKRHWDEREKKKVHVLSIVDPEYPESLRRSLCENAPVLLLGMFKLDLLKRKSVGFSVARGASEKRMSAAQNSAVLLAGDGINIVSAFA